MRLTCCKSLLITATVLTPAIAGARPVETEFISVNYHCERDIELPVVFVNDTQGRSQVIALIDGKLLTLPQAASASGARYHSDDGVASYELWNKGDTATVSYGTNNASEIIYKDCVEIPEEEGEAAEE